MLGKQATTPICDNQPRPYSIHEPSGHLSPTNGVDWLTSGIVHDFNNILTVILNQVSLALNEIPADSPARDHMEKAARSTRHATDLTHQLLNYVTKGEVPRESLDLNQVILNSVDLLDVKLSDRFEVSLNLAADLRTILASRSQMQQVLLNLLVNATEAIVHPQGQIIISTRNITIASSETRNFLGGDQLAGGQYVLLEIQDNGIGIDQYLLDRIFKPFFTTKPGGSGIGLATTLAIVRSHNGGIQVRSARGRGSTFCLLLPAMESPQSTMSPGSTCEANRVGNDVILIIDDEEAIRQSLSEILESAGYNTLTATSGPEGLETFQEVHQRIGVVLLDVRMAGLNGIRILQALRQRKPAQPVILSSGYSRAEIGYSFNTDPYTMFLRKPYDMGQLLSSVRAALALPSNSSS